MPHPTDHAMRNLRYFIGALLGNYWDMTAGSHTT
jgi:hypothetical protein